MCRRNINWNNLINFHKEICQRAEKIFFSLPFNNYSEQSKWSPLINITPLHNNFFDKFNETNISNINFLNHLKNNHIETVFLAGPCYVHYSNKQPEFQPFLYMELQVIYAENGDISFIPVSQWAYCPLIIHIFDYTNYVLDRPLNVVIEEIIRHIDYNNDDNDNSTLRLIDEICLQLNIFKKYFNTQIPNDLRRNHNISRWTIFYVDDNFISNSQHLLRDYSDLLDKLNAPNAEIGGLNLFDNLTFPEANEPPEILPVVKLNEPQLKSVRNILSKYLTQISGPPGCGKSQVVLSTLINAWANGEKVLFTSNNNQAVNIIKTKLHNEFENNNPFLIAMRAGSKDNNQIRDGFEKIIRAFLNNEYRLVIQKYPKYEELRAQMNELNERIKNIMDFLNTRTPDVISELKQSSIAAYLEFIKVHNEINENIILLRNDLNNLKYSNIAVEEFEEKIFLPFKNWIDRIDYYKKLIQADNAAKSEIENKIKLYSGDFENNLRLIGFEELHKLNDTNNFVQYNDLILRYEKWIKDLSFFINSPIERHLIDIQWNAKYNDWNNSNEINNWLIRADRLKKSLADFQTYLNANIIEINELQYKFNQSQLKIINADLSENIEINADLINDWLNYYKQILQLNISKFDFLPWSKRNKLIKRLKQIELQLLNKFPISFCDKIGAFNFENRKVFANILEDIIDFYKIKKLWNECEIRKNIENEIKTIHKAAAEINIYDSLNPFDLNALKKYANNLNEIIEFTQSAQNSWILKEKKEQTILDLKNICFKYYELFYENILFLAWQKNKGKSFLDLIEKNYNTPDINSITKLRELLKTDLIDDYISIFKKIIETGQSLNIEKNKLSKIPDKLKRINDWINEKNTNIKITLDKLAGDLPAANSEIYVLLNCYEEFNNKRKSFYDNSLPNLTAKKNEYYKSTKKYIIKADYIIKKYPNKYDSNKLAKIINYFDRNEILDAELLNNLFKEFEPARLISGMQTLNNELIQTSFKIAQIKWFERFNKVISEKPDIINTLENLRNQYNYNNNFIGNDYFNSFIDILFVLPVWITTSQSTQSIPLLPEIFDLLIIDEATQCSITNILPLVYRAKRIAVIGDINQLTAISNIGIQSELFLKQKYGINDNIFNLLGYNDNNIFLAVSRCLGNLDERILLNEHFRSHPLIIGFSNKYIYQNRLDLTQNLYGDYYNENDGIFGKDIKGKAERGVYNSSWINKIEAEAVCNLIEDLLETNPHSSIGIVTPFKAQGELLEKILTDRRNIKDITIGTAHKFQGDEKDIIIFSAVAADGMPSNSVKWIETPPNLINVAVTRARKKLYILADFNFCRRQNGILANLIKFVDTVEILRNTSQEELILFSRLIMEGLSPEVHKNYGAYELDFVLTAGNNLLNIEVDGLQHTPSNDEIRDIYLRGLGFTILRFPAKDVRESLENVIMKIKRNL